MLKKIAITVFSLFCSSLIGAEQLKTVFNPHTGVPDFITALTTTSIQAGAGVTVSTTINGVIIGSTGGGGATNGTVLASTPTNVTVYFGTTTVTGYGNLTNSGTMITAKSADTTGAIPAITLISTATASLDMASTMTVELINASNPGLGGFVGFDFSIPDTTTGVRKWGKQRYAITNQGSGGYARWDMQTVQGGTLLDSLSYRGLCVFLAGTYYPCFAVGDIGSGLMAPLILSDGLAYNAYMYQYTDGSFVLDAGRNGGFRDFRLGGTDSATTVNRASFLGGYHSGSIQWNDGGIGSSNNYFSSTAPFQFNSSTTFNGNVNISSGVKLSGSAGTNGQVFTSGGANTIPTWTTISGGGGATNGTVLASTPTNMAVYSNTTTVTGYSNFTNDGTNILVTNTIQEIDSNFNNGYGAGALAAGGGGFFNSAFGSNALASSTGGGQNTAFGLNSLNAVVSGASNSAIGYLSGSQEFGSKNTYIGALAGNSAARTLDHAVGIGYNSNPVSSFTMLLGGLGVDAVRVIASTITASSATYKTFNTTGTYTAFGTVNISSGVRLSNSAGTSGQVFTSAGANSIPTWTTPIGQTPWTADEDENGFSLLSGDGMIKIARDGGFTGIGTATPSRTFQVAQQGIAFPTITLDGAGNATGTGFLNNCYHGQVITCHFDGDFTITVDHVIDDTDMTILEPYGGSFSCGIPANDRFVVMGNGNTGIRNISPRNDFQIGGYGGLLSTDYATQMTFTGNYYYDGNWRYINSDAASMITLTGGAITFYTDVAGVADDVVAPTEALSIVGAPPDGYALCLNGGQLGHCSSVISIGGACTCTVP